MGKSLSAHTCPHTRSKTGARRTTASGARASAPEAVARARFPQSLPREVTREQGLLGDYYSYTTVTGA